MKWGRRKGQQGDKCTWRDGHARVKYKQAALPQAIAIAVFLLQVVLDALLQRVELAEALLTHSTHMATSILPVLGSCPKAS